MAQESILWKQNAIRVCNKYCPLINKLRRDIATGDHAARYKLEDTIYNFRRTLTAMCCKISVDFIDVIHYKHIKVYDVTSKSKNMDGRFKVDLEGRIVDADKSLHFLRDKYFEKVVPFMRRNKTVRVSLRQVNEYEIDRIRVDS